VITLDASARSTTPAKIEAQGWVMQQLLTKGLEGRPCGSGAREHSDEAL